MVNARKSNAKLDVPEVKNRFLKHYNRQKLAIASRSKALLHCKPMEMKAEPNDSDLFANWINAWSFKVGANKDAMIVDFKRPIIINMILVPNCFM